MSEPSASESVETTPVKTPALEVRDLSVYYANSAVGVSHLNLTVAAGEVVAILGRNGAGKTTTLRGIAGFLRNERVTITGQILVGGNNIAGLRPMTTFRRGIVLVPERDKVFSKLTVEEHLRLASNKTSADRMLVFPALDRLRKSKAGLLSGGERQMLAMEVAWRSDPNLLMADEVSLGLAPVIVKSLLEQLRTTARERGSAVIVVEQDAAMALRIADRVYVINHGEVLWEGLPQETSPTKISQQYLGVER
jgi:branched-chain amino acid transport system ATP-binding protein